ncbi:hypothetical protein AURDEDRAFT_115944 [Auricularia subglabra TFB-10046 SS5]|uniref:Nudix hydrolase domain-containing protein n=1 Tax=Auricularia subglabra (strain TFB-10046 / SS5) TaxID=717982 RepID=J0D1U6_AURST|nr:hypothetical protein AURDEDRAFT_115944 [Auricularia subglabra TFB-10046 SS5]
MSFQIGAVVINQKDEVLLFENIASGISRLPRFDGKLLDVACLSPFKFLYDQSQLEVDRLPLLMTKRQYRNSDAESYDELEQELVFENTFTTSPFSVGLDVAWFRIKQDPLYPDGRQCVVNWYSGIIRGNSVPSQSNDIRVHFLPIAEAISAVSDNDYVAENALRAFDTLWTATKHFQAGKR